VKFVAIGDDLYPLYEPWWEKVASVTRRFRVRRRKGLV
jgi:hypothetical protein